jgi:uncharacterized protein (DUF2249 family)
MNDVVLATNDQDAAAASLVLQHHAELSGALALRVEALVSAVSRGDRDATRAATAELRAWSAGELLPHARAEEASLYPAAHVLPGGRLLVTALLAEHDLIEQLVRAIAVGADPVGISASATALRVLVESHIAKENDLLVPLLAENRGTPLRDLLQAMHAAAAAVPAGSQDEAAPSVTDGCGGHTCGCGESDVAGAYPELDVRAVPHAIRHATVFGALKAVPPGGGMVLVAHHDPIPLLAQVEHRFSGAFVTSYLERGPEVWRIAFDRNPVITGISGVTS